MIVNFIPNRAKLKGSKIGTVGIFFCFDMVVAIGYVYFGWTWLALPYIPVTVLGSAISVLIGFRNANSYQRWWEARTIWGAIVNNSRTLGLQVVSLMRPTAETDSEEVAAMQRRIAYHQIAYVNAFRCQLRGQEPWPELIALLPADEIESLRSKRQVAVEIQKTISRLVRECFDRGWIDSIRWASIDSTLAALMGSQGAAERIKNTPLPRQYDLLPHVFTILYCGLLPLGIVEQLGMLTPIGSSLIGFVLLVWDLVGMRLENPFDNGENDVALTSICRTIEISLRQQLGETSLPEPLKPVDGVLW
jgi:ion channel-forming bestrophin family protein